MKQIYLLLSLLLVAGGASARRISESEALALASSRVPGLETDVAARLSVGSVTGNVNRPVYMFNSRLGGFAIVAGDDRMPNMLLAYSESGTLDPDGFPPAMKAWLDGAAAFIEQGDFSAVTANESGGLDYSSPVGPLLSTKWDQSAPYNLLTPATSTADGHCLTGCAATAMAQVLNYWQYPREGGLCEHSYTWKGNTYTVDFRESRYDWANMADTYSNGDDDPTVARNIAVAKLMYDCGVSVNMQYGDKVSNAFDFDVAAALADIFGLSKGTRLRMRDAMNQDDWNALVKSELDGRRPLIYFGMTPSDEGHAFVCDGYDATGLFHINWGWSGQCDGYFDLSTLAPEIHGSGGAASGRGFSERQSIITGVCPPYEGEVAAPGYEMATYGFYLVPADNDGKVFTVNSLIANIGFRPFDGSLLVYCYKVGDTDDGDATLIKEFEDEPLTPGQIYKIECADLETDYFTDGTWEMKFVTTDSSAPSVETPVAQYSSCPPCQFEIKDGRLVIDPRPHLVIENFNVEPLDYFVTTPDGVRCQFACLSFDVSNNSGIPYTNAFSIGVKYDNGVIMDKTSVDFSVYPDETIGSGETVSIEVPVYYNVNSEVAVKISEKQLDDQPLFDPIFTDAETLFVSSDTYHELAFADEPVATETEGLVTIVVPVVSCFGDGSSREIDEDYEIERLLKCVIFDPVSESIVRTATADFSGKWHEPQTVTFETDEPLADGDYIAMVFYTSTPNILGQTLDLYLGQEEDFEGLPISVNTMGIDNVIASGDAAREEIYSVGVIRLSGADRLAPGVYISRRGGEVKKIVIR